MYRRFFAWALAKASSRYERLVARRKRELLGGLEGVVVELGPGTGANLPYYGPGVQWIGIEPNRYMHGYLRREAWRLGRRIALHQGRAEHLALPDASADAVVSTLVLCSVSDLELALGEVLRVLRPGGRFVFLEHVAAPRSTWRRRMQRAVRPIWSRLGDGCRPDRETWQAIERAGFTEVVCDHFRLPIPVVWPHIAGWARK